MRITRGRTEFYSSRTENNNARNAHFMFFADKGSLEREIRFVYTAQASASTDGEILGRKCQRSRSHRLAISTSFQHSFGLCQCHLMIE